MGDGFEFGPDVDFSFTAAKLAWKLGTKIGTELGKLVDGTESIVPRPGGGRVDINYDHLPAPLFDYGNL